jgi:hypothetical protein
MREGAATATHNQGLSLIAGASMNKLQITNTPGTGKRNRAWCTLDLLEAEAQPKACQLSTRSATLP